MDHMMQARKLNQAFLYDQAMRCAKMVPRYRRRDKKLEAKRECLQNLLRMLAA